MATIRVESAIEIAEQYLNDRIRDPAVFKDCRFVVERDLTKEFDDHWIFFYQTDRYIETGDLPDALVGNLPIKVSKTGEILGFCKG